MSPLGEITGSLSDHDGNSSKNVTQNKRVRAVSNFISLVLFHAICLMLGNSSGVDSKGWYLSSEKEIERETRKFHVMVVKQQQ